LNSADDDEFASIRAFCDTEYYAGHALRAQLSWRVIARWRELHQLSWSWIAQGRMRAWPLRTAQVFALAVWPLRWQYQAYHYCRPA